MKGLKVFVAFALGSIVGGVIGYGYAKKKCGMQASKDIQDAQEHYEAMAELAAESMKSHEGEIENLRVALKASHDHIEYQDAEIERLKGRSLFIDDMEKNGYSEDLLPGKKPYFIDPLDQGPDYRTVSLQIYDDQVVTDETDKPMSIDDIYDAIGSEMYETLQMGDDDFYCIRNEKLRCDFEITRVPYDYDTGGD